MTRKRAYHFFISRWSHHLIALLMFCLLSSNGLYALTPPQHTDKADALKAIGLLNGTANGYELERAPNRLEAAVMLVRLLGKEQIAKTNHLSHPFTDVPTWANDYIGYLYENNLAQGISSSLFGSTQVVDAKTYMTFILRALHYKDDLGDFTWQVALSYGQSIGILTSSENAQLTGHPFLRDDMILLSYKALKTKLKSSPSLLVDQLITENSVSALSAVLNGFVDKTAYRSQLVPINKLSGTFNTIDTTQDHFIYYDQETTFTNYTLDQPSASGLLFITPLMDGWDRNLVAKLSFYNQNQLVKTMYAVITTNKSVSNNQLTFHFVTPKDTYTSVSYSIFEANDYFIYDNLPKTTLHKIPIAKKETALPLLLKAKYIDSDLIDSNSLPINDTRLILHAHYSQTTFYKGTDIYDLYFTPEDVKNGFKFSGKIIGTPPLFTFTKTTTDLTQFQSSLSLKYEPLGKYTLLINPNQFHTFVLRNADYQITDIIQFTP